MLYAHILYYIKYTKYMNILYKVYMYNHKYINIASQSLVFSHLLLKLSKKEVLYEAYLSKGHTCDIKNNRTIMPFLKSGDMPFCLNTTGFPHL